MSSSTLSFVGGAKETKEGHHVYEKEYLRKVYDKLLLDGTDDVYALKDGDDDENKSMLNELITIADEDVNKDLVDEKKIEEITEIVSNQIKEIEQLKKELEELKKSGNENSDHVSESTTESTVKSETHEISNRNVCKYIDFNNKIKFKYLYEVSTNNYACRPENIDSELKIMFIKMLFIFLCSTRLAWFNMYSKTDTSTIIGDGDNTKNVKRKNIFSTIKSSILGNQSSKNYGKLIETSDDDNTSTNASYSFLHNMQKEIIKKSQSKYSAYYGMYSIECISHYMKQFHIKMSEDKGTNKNEKLKEYVDKIYGLLCQNIVEQQDKKIESLSMCNQLRIILDEVIDNFKNKRDYLISDVNLRKIACIIVIINKVFDKTVLYDISRTYNIKLPSLFNVPKKDVHDYHKKIQYIDEIKCCLLYGIMSVSFFNIYILRDFANIFDNLTYLKVIGEKMKNVDELDMLTSNDKNNVENTINNRLFFVYDCDKSSTYGKRRSKRNAYKKKIKKHCNKKVHKKRSKK